MQMSVAENAVLGRGARLDLLILREESSALDPVFRSLALKAASRDAPVSTLSGGNQQKVLLARCLLANPDVLFLDDPTRGIDVARSRRFTRSSRNSRQRVKESFSSARNCRSCYAVPIGFW